MVLSLSLSVGTSVSPKPHLFNWTKHGPEQSKNKLNWMTIAHAIRNRLLYSDRPNFVFVFICGTETVTAQFRFRNIVV